MLHKAIQIIKCRFTNIEKNRWFFESLNGDYSDSPKALSEFIHKQMPEVDITWGCAEDKVSSIPSYAHTAVFGSDNYYYSRSKSKVIIGNIMFGGHSFERKDCVKLWLHRIVLKLSFKPKQCLFSTWHGGPLKRIGRDQKGFENRTLFATPKYVMFTGNSFTKEILERVTFNKTKVLVTGLPRNDILFQKQDNENKKKLGLAGKRIILYAPTFRSNDAEGRERCIERSGLMQLQELDFKSLFDTLKDKFGGDWVFVCRFHYHVSALVDWDELTQKYEGKVVNGNAYDDMALYLSCADVLVSDISTCMIDYLPTYKPCFIFFPDKEYYENTERGLYIPLEEMPFPSAVTGEEFIRNINRFNREEYIQKVDSFSQKLGVADDGIASARILDYIKNDLCI